MITVKAGGDRTSANAIGPLAGVTLRLYDGTSAPTIAVDQTWATCVSDAAGDCSFTVPDTQVGGANRDRRFWVVETGVPSGWTSNDSLVTGPGGGGPFASRRYTFQTPETLRSQTTYATTGTQDFMRGTGDANASASGGIWQHSRTDPSLVSRCGVRVALVIDVSGSVGSSLGELKGAADTFVDSLTGTPSSVALYTFGTNAPANTTNNQNRPPTAVSTPAGASTVKGYIDGLTAGTNTNWDRGLYQVAVSTAAYDIAVVITDGNPTVYSNGPTQGPGTYTRFREVESGIFSANALKAKGTRVVAVGVGVGIADGADNLRAISGTVKNQDYYQTDNYAQAGRSLRSLALGSCEGTLTVVKEVVPPGGAPADATVSGGWTMTASDPSAELALTTPATAATRGGSGAVNFGLSFSGGSSTGQLTVTETQQAGYTLLQQSGQNAACRRSDTNAPVAVTNVGALGFRPAVFSDYPVTCVVLNQAPEPPATVVLNAIWDIDGAQFRDGEQPPDFVAQARLDGTAVAWGNVRTGFSAGDTPAVTEDPVTFAATRPGCRLTSSRLTDRNGTTVDQALPQSPTLVAGDNAYTITNTVTCQTRLQLLDTVTNGSASPDAWTLRAAKPGDDDLDFTSGTTGVEGPITSNVGYLLSESGGDPAYVQRVNPQATLPAGATGSWDCVELDASGTVVPGFTDGLNGRVTARRGASVRCTAINDTATLRLRKQVENTHGGTAVPADWKLIATPAGQSSGVEPVEVPGAEAYAGFDVRPGVKYGLTESGGPSGYALRSLTCASDDESAQTAATDVAVDVLETGSCTFVNADQPARLTLRKVVDAGTTGSTRAPADWDVTATPSADIAGQGAVTGNGDPTSGKGVSAVAVDAGSYTLSEDGPDGFTAGTWSCDGATVSGSVVTVAIGATVVCEITNTAVAPTLTLVTTVVNDDGGTAVPTDWTLTASGPAPGRGTPISGVTGTPAVTSVAVPVGGYQLDESGPPAYTSSAWTCEGAVYANGVVTLAEGDAATCTIVNDDQPPSWTLTKTSDPASGSMVQPGSVVTYTLVATSTGDAPVAGATVTDDLSSVLDHAELEAVPDGATLSGSTMTWTVPTLADDGDAAVLTYRVRVDDDAVDVTLTNVATPNGVGGTCLGCETVDTTPPDSGTSGGGASTGGGETGGASTGGSTSPLASTGGPSPLLPLTGVVLLVAGRFLLRRRHSTDS